MARAVVFLGGVAAESPSERDLAYHCGLAIGRLGFALYHGGYNGLMEEVARGASSEGCEVVAVTLRHKSEWGAFNRYVARSIYVTDMGQRLDAFFASADVVIAMGGGVGTLHELAAAIWYAGNIRRIPVILLGKRAERLVSALREERWIYESPTRQLDFLLVAHTADELSHYLNDPNIVASANQRGAAALLEQRLIDAAMVKRDYVRADGIQLTTYFDPFRLCAHPTLVQSAATAVMAQVRAECDAVAGIALGGVPLATHIALLFGKPLLVVRPKPKEYGTHAQVEGVLEPESRVLLIDDVVRHGKAMLAARRALQAANHFVTEAACILSRGHVGRELLRQQGVTLYSLMVRNDSDDDALESPGDG
jgi:uncharacterized protein (TIGR00725 family)